MNVLYLEDDPHDADLASRALARAAPDIHIEIVKTVAAAIERIAGCEASLSRGGTLDLDEVLLDMNLPDGNGLEVLAEIRHRNLPLAVVVLTGSGDEESVLAALRAGADDYLPKRSEYWNQLPAALRVALANFRSHATGASRILRLLYVEPKRHDVELTRRYLAAHAPNIRIETTDTAEQALERLPRSGLSADVDVMLIDYRLPGMNALDALKEIRQFRDIDLPIILITGHGTEDIALQALKLGAADYIVKSPGYLAHLPSAVENAFHRARAARENTELLERERALRDSEERFRQLAENIREVFWLSDPSHQEVLYVSPAYEEIWGRSCKSLYESPGDWIEAIHPDDRERVMRAVIDKQARGTYNEEYRIRRPDGSIRWIRDRAFPVTAADGEVYRIAGVAEDITDHKTAEQALKSNELRKSAIVETALDCIITMDAEGKVIEFNPAAEKTFGYSRAEALGKLIGGMIVPPSLRQAHQRGLRHFHATGEGPILGKRIEVAAMRKDGTEFPVELTVVPIALPDQTIFSSHLRDITERKRAEATLRESEAQLRSFVEQAPASIAMFDRNMIYLAASRRWAADYGRGHPNLVGLNQYEVHPDMPKAWREIHRKGLGGEAQRCDEDLWIQADGTSNWLRWAVQPWRDVHGDIGGIMILAEDITRRKQVEDEIRETKNFLASIFDNIPNSIFVKDARDLTFVRANAACEKLTGFSEKEMLGKSDYDFFPREQADFFVAKDRETIASNQRIFIVEEEITSKDGTTRILRTKKFPIVDGQGQPQYLLGMSEDITEQKHAEKQLRESEEKFRQLIEQASDGIFVSDPEGRFLLVNSAGCKLLGYSEEELLGLKIAETYLEEERPLHLERMRRVPSGAAVRFERIARHKDGSTFPTEVSLTQLKNGTVQGFFNDITERRAQEQKIVRLSRIQAVLSGINSAIVRIRDRHDLFREACRIILEHGGFNLGWIGVLDQATGKLIAVAQAGLPEETISTVFNGSIGLVPAGAAAVTIRDRRTAIDNVIEDAPGTIPAGHEPDSIRVRLAAIELGAKSVISLPLVVEGEIFGVLTVYAPDRNFFDDEEVKLLDELAVDVSFGLTFIAKEEKVDYLAYYDTLTGLPNRTLFFDRLGRQLATAERERRSVALILLDIDRFRMVNDTLGRQAGDILLQAISQRIKDSVRDEDTVARTSADSFAIAVAGAWRLQDVAHLVEARSRSLFGKSFTIGGEELRISATVGAAVYPNDAANQENLVANAEAALRSAKQQNVPLLFYAPEMNAQAAESLRLENRLRRALENQELVLWYQPKTDLKTGKVTGMEALMRWQDPESGLIPPMKFIPVMEQTGMILEAGSWALSQVAVDCRRWVSEGLKPPRIAVNVSPIQLRQKDFVSTVIEAAQATEEAGGALDLEITESVIMENVDAIIPKLQTIRGLGVEIYIDDFGTGYSSLAYIARLPIHALKIDRSFVVGMTQNEESLNIVNSVISLAHSLKLRVVAEGVETDAQTTLLGQLKCDEFQGYLTSKPVPPEKVLALLRKLS